MRIAIFNVGSSSVKSALFDLPADGFPAGPVEPIWGSHTNWGGRQERAGDAVRRLISNMPAGEVLAAGHRVVHGGTGLSSATLIDADVKKEIARLSAFAPEHNSAQLDAINAAEGVFGANTPQVAVFDTAFHSSIPDDAAIYPGPWEWIGWGIRRYGFHGLSHHYAAHRAAELAGRALRDLRVVTCHLGNGASLCAIREARSVDTTMGFTPLEGLMMGTRSGSIDPGILIYLVHMGWTAEKLDTILNRESGLKGLSGISGDMRDILDHVRKGDHRARIAFDVYIHRLCRELGGMIVAAAGLDMLVFTGGVGENSPEVRKSACARLKFAGIELDDDRNLNCRTDGMVSTVTSSAQVWVVASREDVEVARGCWNVLRGTPVQSKLRTG